MKRIKTTMIAVAGILLCGGCETYKALPLDEHPRLADSLAALKSAPSGNWPQVPAVDIAKPLNADGVALLAVLNNPDLVAARADRHIAEAQVLEAGLLPNPQITGSYGFLRAGPGTTDQWSAGLSEDLRALVTFSATRRTAELGAAQTEADLLWQEWQVIGKARLLAVDTVKLNESIRLLKAARALLADRYDRDRRAVREGNLTLASVAPDLAALADIDKLVADADLKAKGQARDLDLLLGLDPSVKLDLAAEMEIPPVDPGHIEGMIRDLPRRRPDLIALRLGYDSQEEKLWTAILAQFPALVLGGSGGHDTSAVYAIGPAVTLDLPIFNRNQGNIAIEKATRAKLHAEYANRLTSGEAEIRGMLSDQLLLQDQLTAARTNADEADLAAHAAHVAYDAALIDARTNADLITAALTRRQEVVSIEQTLLEQQIALATLTGIDMPVADPLPDRDGAP